MFPYFTKNIPVQVFWTFWKPNKKIYTKTMFQFVQQVFNVCPAWNLISLQTQQYWWSRYYDTTPICILILISGGRSTWKVFLWQKEFPALVSWILFFFPNLVIWHSEYQAPKLERPWWEFSKNFLNLLPSTVSATYQPQSLVWRSWAGPLSSWPGSAWPPTSSPAPTLPCKTPLSPPPSPLTQPPPLHRVAKSRKMPSKGWKSHLSLGRSSRKK